jgi:Mn-dependent DtxR family transcriptional regulator
MGQYLKTISIIQQPETGPSSTVDIADRLWVSLVSAKDMIGKRQVDSLTEHEKYKGVELTSSGAKRAQNALQTYCIIERFLVDVLGVEEFRAEASELESVIDDTVAERLDMIIDRRDECPDCFDPETDMCAFLEVPTPVDD